MNKEIIFLFNNLIENNNIKFDNFIPQIINLKFDENSNYKNDLITFTVNQIKNSNLTIKTFPNSMENFLKKSPKVLILTLATLFSQQLKL